jgi:hypothetical protein
MSLDDKYFFFTFFLYNYLVSQYNPQFELFNQLISGELFITGQFHPAYFQTMTRKIKLN